MKAFYRILIVLLIAATNYLAQSTTLKLTSSSNTSSFNVTNSSDAVGLKLYGDAGMYFGGTFGTGTIPVTGSGTRLMWYPSKAAFRAGYVNNDQLDDVNVGIYSTAMGNNSTASGSYSTALGIGTTASKSSSTAIGFYTTASGLYSTALGASTTASGYYSTALGLNTTASGNNSTAIGASTIASGYYSTAMGYATIASGSNSLAMGSNVSTGGKNGSVIIGDYYPTKYNYSTADNQMKMRFAGGYFLYSSKDTLNGVSLAAGGSSWTSISDSTKKQNFVKSNGEYFLNSLSKLKLGSWNYKSQDPKTFRHYGPMAQEIFHYFGKDELGVIGNDTTLATADMDGIMMICLQALEKRTSDLKKAEERITELEKELYLQKEVINYFKNDFVELKKALYNQNGQKEEVKAEFTINK